MIAIEHLTKRYRKTVAVDDLDLVVQPGVVTGFLGPNGSGKSTTMRVIMGLDRPTRGRATINGRPYHDLRDPLREVGALLEAKAVNPGRSARNHLRALAASNKIPFSRVEEVLEFVGLASVATKRVGDFSLGMGQRLGIASALLGDPGILLFDEPVNGLDPEGIRWIRDLFRSLAAEGRTVFVSSHLMSEMAVTADQIIVIGKGRLITQGSVDDLTAAAKGSVVVRGSDRERLEIALRAAGATLEAGNDDALRVGGLTAEAVGRLAFDQGVVLFELTPERASLEEVYMALTAGAVEYGSGAS
ncbi:MAG TPA: ATP-binding cassette domain-containing protein [Acidimicrobiales bacterium]|nr:MAG: multidrug ABC transporter ATP-binding protein [Actinobacteria bacterium 21-73-9]HQU26149.1 ATP-binding cassette domain-containing protein [Acidimicrobiales bacterium]